MTQNWGSQVIFYLFYLAGGMPGIVFLRFILVGILIYVMVKRREGDSILYGGLLLLFLSLVLKSYPIERPQVISFLFFAILLYFLDKLKEKPDKSAKKIYFIIPLLMVLWANMHGGFILGNVTLILYIVLEGIKFVHPSLRPINKESYGKLLVIGLLGLAFSFISPNTYHFLSESILLQSDNLTSNNLEYQSTLRIFLMFNDYSVVVYWFILALTVSGLVINRKKIDITELALLAGIGFFSFTTLRYVAFFVIAALPVVARLFSESNLLKPFRILIFTGSLFIGIFFTWAHIDLDNIKTGGWISADKFPVTATEFIIENGLKGNMYNFYNWGGYLIWRLAPERKVFIDGRGLKLHRRLELSSLIYNASEEMFEGMPQWKAVLQAYNIQYIVIPFTRQRGRISRLEDALLQDRDWIPVFQDYNAIIFVKASPLNYDVIRKYSLSEDYLMYKYFNQ
jgi:hypothetical protein